MTMMRRRELLGAGAALAATAARVPHAMAQNFPSKPIRWIAPFAAGGNYDVTSRLVGTEAAANAAADGYTVVMTRPDGRFADMRAALAEAKAKPGTVSVGHAGNGTTNHIAILRLQANEGVKVNIIPYRGSGPGLADLMAGQIDLYVDQLTTSLPHIKSGKLRCLLALSLERVPQLADVPTLGDVGSKPFDGGTTAGLFARIETPKPILATLNGAVVTALKDPSVASKLGELGAVVRPTATDEFAAYMKDQEAGVSEFVKSGLLKPE